MSASNVAREPIRPIYANEVLEGQGEEDIVCQPCGEENGITVAKCRRSLQEPTADEILAHDATHVPFRSWCPHCVQAAGKATPHNRAVRDEDNAVPGLHVDYWFM